MSKGLPNAAHVLPCSTIIEPLVRVQPLFQELANRLEVGPLVSPEVDSSGGAPLVRAPPVGHAAAQPTSGPLVVL